MMEYSDEYVELIGVLLRKISTLAFNTYFSPDISLNKKQSISIGFYYVN